MSSSRNSTRSRGRQAFEFDGLHVSQVRLRLATKADIASLTRIWETPEVSRWWPDMDEVEVSRLIVEGEPWLTTYVIEVGGTVGGCVQVWEEPDPEYRHAGLDIMVSPQFQGEGIGPQALRQIARKLFAAGHHRITIDPRAENTRARRAYEKVGFKEVGVMRRYELDPVSGEFRDGVLYDLLEEDLT